jgi:hypothetical protein
MLNRGAIVALALCTLAYAQYTTASLGGAVTDATGARIVGTKVSVKNSETGFALSTVSDDEGGFLFPRLPISNYELRQTNSASLPMFRKES